MSTAAVATPVHPPRVVGPSTKKATRPETPLPRYLIEEAKLTTPVPFNSQAHLNYQKPAKVLSMKEIGLEGQGVSLTGASEPFPLFTEEAVAQIRREIFSDEVLQNCQYSSTFIKHMVRGMNADRAPFTYAAWNSPELISKVSEAIGVDVIPHIDFEIANINITWNGQTTTTDAAGGAVEEDPLADPTSAVAWHYDSFPIVCVVMLSDCTGMVGGETALKLPCGGYKKVRGPSQGTAVVMQGRYIEHQALKAMGGRERISMVTCFRPKNPMIKDETILTGVRGISNLPELYDQYTEYRLELLEERFRIKGRIERKRRQAKKTIDVDDVRRFLTEQRDFLDSMLIELI